MKQRFFLSFLILFHATIPSTIQAHKADEYLDLTIKTGISAIIFCAVFYACAKLTEKAQSSIWQTFYPYTINESFNSVAGAHEAKESLQEIVQFLKNPKKFSRLGAKIPKGVLLTGNPGTGKTLLARAVAGEANCTFISVSGSAFEEMYAGLGASRVRDLFKEAEKQNGPCIIFIDEIDAVASKRQSIHTWLNQTLNQLLTCMDGFSTKESKYPIIVIGATNHESILDPALLRAGRFDRIVNVPLPSHQDRIDILEIHLQPILTAEDVNLENIAKNTSGFSGADLAQLVNQATLIATKNNQELVTMENFHEAINIIHLGAPSAHVKMSAREKKITAYHEAGHTLLHLLQPETSGEFYNVTIVPRSRALGLTASFPDENKHSWNKEEMLARICMLLAGRGAEELMFDEIGTGAHNDFEKASDMAFHMVCSFGMTELGTRIYNTKHISDATRHLIDKAVAKILDEQYKKVLNILQDNKKLLIKLAEELLKKETLYAPEVYKLLELKPLDPVAA
jgi:cell division protease FtsH